MNTAKDPRLTKKGNFNTAKDERLAPAVPNKNHKIFVAIENEYHAYWKCTKATLISVWKRSNKIHCANFNEFSKDQLITDILTYHFGSKKMDIWRSHF